MEVTVQGEDQQAERTTESRPSAAARIAAAEVAQSLIDSVLDASTTEASRICK